MSQNTPGRYRQDHARARPARTVFLAGAVLAVALVAALQATVFRSDSYAGADQPGTALLADDRSESSSRGADRGPDHHRSPLTEPTAAATVLGPVVGGRHQPAPVTPPQSGDGTYEVVSGEASPPRGASGDNLRYRVEVERGLPFDPDAFAEDVHTILNDDRGWGPVDDVRFTRVDDDRVDFTVSLSSPDMTDEQCAPLLTRGEVSCWNGSRAVINALRWGIGAETFGHDLLSYREYLINHEVGHALGHGHVNCPSDGEPAPVMVQQTKSLEGCAANPWPSR